MSTQITQNINVDFSNSKLITVNAKQYDRSSRFITVSCFNNGKRVSLSSLTHHAYIRYRKPDNLGVFNACQITVDGKLLVNLTEQMLAASGTAYADLVIYELRTVDVDLTANDELELSNLDDTSVLATMTFVVKIQPASFDNKEVESSYEYDALNDLLVKATTDYSEVINSSRASQQAAAESEAKAKASENAASLSEGAAENSAKSASESETAAANSANAASESQQAASESETAAANSANAASESQTAAANSASAAEISQQAASESETAAANSANAAQASQQAAAESEANAKASEESVAQNTETVKNITEGLVGGFIPCGTVAFEELATVEKITGFTYNISNDFVTDDTFREGAGFSYSSGTNVYWTNTDEWDCLGGTMPEIASVAEIETYLEI